MPSVVVQLPVELGREANRLAHSRLAFVSRCASVLFSPVVVLSVDFSVRCMCHLSSSSVYWFVTFLVTLLIVPTGCIVGSASLSAEFSVLGGLCVLLIALAVRGAVGVVLTPLLIG